MKNPDRDRLIIEITACLQSLQKRSLTSEELAVVLTQEVIAPYVEEIRDNYTRLAFAHGATYPI